jgi:hypothetical protein
MNCGPDLSVDAPPFLLLCGIIKGKERCPWVPLISSPDMRSSPHVWVTAHLDQRPGWLRTDPKRHRLLLRWHLLWNGPSSGRGGRWHGHGGLPHCHICQGHLRCVLFHLPRHRRDCLCGLRLWLRCFACDITAAPGRTTSTMGAPDVPSSAYSPMDATISCADMTTYADDNFGSIVFACDVAAVPGHAMSTTGAPDMPSSICSLMDVATGRASPVDAMAALAPLLLTFGVAPADSWHAGQKVRLFLSAILRGVPLPLTLQKTRRSAHGEIC